MQSAISQGILWGVMTLGIYITFKILDIPDMTCDGSFALGGCVSATLILKGMNPFLTLIISIIAGMIAGSITGLLHTKLKIPAILAGILSMIALYSINIRIMGGPNNSLLGMNTIFTKIIDSVGTSQAVTMLIIGLILTVLVIFILYWFFGTEIGSAIRATGNNPYMVRAQGTNTDTTIIIGLVISNGLISLSGALVGQSQGYSDVKMGTGAIVIGLASIVIGEVIFGKRFNFAYILLSVVLGSVIYRMIIALVLYLGLSTDDMKLITAIIVAIALGIPTLKKKLSARRIPA
ncbi:MAG: ABC transporter permease [Lachnospiraceae bacterium]